MADNYTHPAHSTPPTSEVEDVRRTLEDLQGICTAQLLLLDLPMSRNESGVWEPDPSGEPLRIDWTKVHSVALGGRDIGEPFTPLARTPPTS